MKGMEFTYPFWVTCDPVLPRIIQICAIETCYGERENELEETKTRTNDDTGHLGRSWGLTFHAHFDG